MSRTRGGGRRASVRAIKRLLAVAVAIAIDGTMAQARGGIGVLTLIAQESIAALAMTVSLQYIMCAPVRATQ